jgi:hypothetical protein
MKKFSLRCTLNAIACCSLTVACANAWAEVWIETSKTDDYVTYADPSSIRRDGDIVKMWSMFDYRQPQAGIPGKPYQSARRRFEYDCKQSLTRALEVSSHAAHDGKGAAIATASVKYNWSAVVKQSADEYLLKFACKNYDASQGK